MSDCKEIVETSQSTSNNPDSKDPLCIFLDPITNQCVHPLGQRPSKNAALRSWKDRNPDKFVCGLREFAVDPSSPNYLLPNFLRGEDAIVDYHSRKYPWMSERDILLSMTAQDRLTIIPVLQRAYCPSYRSNGAIPTVDPDSTYNLSDKSHRLPMSMLPQGTRYDQEEFKDFEKLGLNPFTLQSGKIFTFPQLSYVDFLTQMLVESATYRLGLEKFGTYESFAIKLKEELARKRFHGGITNCVIGIIANKLLDEETDKGEVYQYLVSCDLNSTGRGTIGSCLSEIRIYRKTKQSSSITVTQRILKKTQGLDALNNLISSSQNTWAAKMIEALRNPLSAGLPSLGKKR